MPCAARCCRWPAGSPRPRGCTRARAPSAGAAPRRGASGAGAAALAGNAPALDLLAEELRLAQNALGEITGEFTADDLLGVIFSQFCIGKDSPHLSRDRLLFGAKDGFDL